ncbi:hypothetical protein HMPREF0061_0512 [Aerococcus viridans ATCC 11563 = CCUG 4311]|uniref:Membrane protein insertion efficiency factor YidD n=1 Tax=Aerococcus viridans (strain ATCC 11563 / DSM 20340 / CCUG 4311 / JCM 20461 / NBRC 12219 / NCTC 8251 / M1) TaxID=655812 RepID=A0ABP2I846_AERVM|nr:hypothetical protein HMPREF0061_0512 [Aerococcus viridans ATCC 11563 = CCUG 4311]
MISPLLPPRCREYPTCSHPAVEGVGKHGATKGSLMQAGRICGVIHLLKVDMI